MNIQSLLDEFKGEYHSLVIIIYFCNFKEEKIKIKYKGLEQKLDISKYKQKQSISYLEKRNMIRLEEKGSKRNKDIYIHINYNHVTVKLVMEVINSMNQLELIKGITKPDYSRERSEKPVPGFPFKYKGNSVKDLIDYSLQKYTQAELGLINWEEVTPRDLAVILAITCNYKKMQIYDLKKANWCGSLIKKYFLSRDVINKQNFCVVAVEFLKVYKELYNNEMGVTWNYIDKHTTHRKKILDEVEEKIYNKSKSEDLPDFF